MVCVFCFVVSTNLHTYLHTIQVFLWVFVIIRKYAILWRFVRNHLTIRLFFLILRVLKVNEHLKVVDGLLKVFPAVLAPVTANVLDDIPLKERDSVGVNEPCGLDAELLVMVATLLLVKCAHVISLALPRMDQVPPLCPR